MTEEALVELIKKVRVTSEVEKKAQAVSALGEFVYTKFHQFKLDCVDEDIKSDYFVWLYPRFPDIIDKYDPDKASFRTYLNWVIRLSFRTFLRAWYCAEARQRAYETEEHTRLLSVEAEQTSERAEWVSDAGAQYTLRVIRRSFANLSSKRREIHARKIYLLACKTGVQLDDSVLAEIAEAMGFEPAFLREKLEIIHRKYASLFDERQRVIEKRNGYYIRSRRCLVEMRYLERNSPRYEELDREYRYSLKRWNRLQSHYPRRTRAPSNRFLAGTLGMSRGTIDATLASAFQDGYASSP